MKNRKTALICSSLVFLILLTIIGCTHQVELTDFKTGETLEGGFNTGNREVWVFMPDGIKLTGKYSSVSGDTVGFSFGSASAIGSSGTYATATGSGTSWGFSNNHTGYALLKNPDTDLMMEVIVHANMSNHGWGEARTNDGRVYKVQF